MPTALVQGRIAVQYTDLLRQNLEDDWSILVWNPATNTPDEFATLAHEADAIIGGGIPLKRWPETPKLKMFQIPWTGHDFCSPATMPAGIPVCNCFEHESTMAEYVMAAILEWTIGLRDMDRRFRAEGWGGRAPGEAVFHGEVRGRTVGIIGYGHIGIEIASRAKAFGMRIIGTRRTMQQTPAPLDWLGTADCLPKLLAESDFVVVACDLNDGTRGLIGKTELDAMKPNSVLINVARGLVVQEDALYAALNTKSIGGAIIDVWYNHISPKTPDVWPSNLPFHELDNVILSPHESAAAPEQVARRWQFVATNINRPLLGKTPKNIVFEGAQITN